MSNETIKANQIGPTLDIALKAIYDAENTDNNDKVVYIRNGEMAFDSYDNLFDIVPLS